MFFGFHKQVFETTSLRDLDTRVNFKRSSTFFSLRYSSWSCKKCTALCSRLPHVGRDNSNTVCPPVVGTDTFTGVTEQTLTFKTFPSIPRKHPISTLSGIHDELGRGYVGARHDTTQQSGQTPDKEVEIKHITVYVSGHTVTDPTGMSSPPTVWHQQNEFVSRRQSGQMPAAVCLGFECRCNGQNVSNGAC